MAAFKRAALKLSPIPLLTAAFLLLEPPPAFRAGPLCNTSTEDSHPGKASSLGIVR